MVVHQGEEGGQVCGYVWKAQKCFENANLSTFSILGMGWYVKYFTVFGPGIPGSIANLHTFEISTNEKSQIPAHNWSPNRLISYSSSGGKNVERVDKDDPALACPPLSVADTFVKDGTWEINAIIEYL